MIARRPLLATTVTGPPAAIATALIVLGTVCETGCTGPAAPDAPGLAASARTPEAASLAEGIPRDYVLVGALGARTVSSLPPHPSELSGPPNVGAGFGFVITEIRSIGGARYLRLHDGRWLPATAVRRAQPSSFAGVALTAADTPWVGWVVAPRTIIRRNPDPASTAVTTRAYQTRLHFTGPCVGNWCPLPLGWARAADLALLTRGPALSPVAPSRGPAPDLGKGEPARWIDVDLEHQTLVAYEGSRPVYATLISSGIGAPGSPLATPTGTFRIRSKHPLARMDNLEHSNVVPYAYDVPLTQYFVDNKALHATMWHDRFGFPSSHGCVNLSPRDAAWLYRFTAPAASFDSAEAWSTAARPGTVIRVRGTWTRLAGAAPPKALND